MEQSGGTIESGSDQRVDRPEIFLDESEVTGLREKLEDRQKSWKQGEGSEVLRIAFSDLKNPEDLAFLKRYFERDLSESEIDDYFQSARKGNSSQRELCALARGQFMNDFSERKYRERLNRQRAA